MLVAYPSARQLQEAGYYQQWNADFTQSKWVNVAGQVWSPGQPVMAFTPTMCGADIEADYIARAQARISIQQDIAAVLLQPPAAQPTTQTYQTINAVEKAIAPSNIVNQAQLPTTLPTVSYAPTGAVVVPANSYTPTAQPQGTNPLSNINKQTWYIIVAGAAILLAVVVFKTRSVPN
jgi:hypothetical protein